MTWNPEVSIPSISTIKTTFNYYKGGIDMTNLSSIFTVLFTLTFVSLMLVSPAFGQEAMNNEDEPERETTFMMLNQNVCPQENMSEVADIWDESLAPILNEMRNEGEIIDWGILTHHWGDEYNFNFFIETDDHAGFVEVWSEFVERSQEKAPEAFEQLAPLCTLHKDNLYTLHRYTH